MALFQSVARCRKCRIVARGSRWDRRPGQSGGRQLLATLVVIPGKLIARSKKWYRDDACSFEHHPGITPESRVRRYAYGRREGVKIHIIGLEPFA